MSVRLGRRHRLAIDATLAVLLATGVAWLLLDRDDASDAAHALLRNDARVHAFAGLACVYLIGTLWLLHIRRAWRNRRNRTAGALTFGLTLSLVATGYALGYATGDVSHLLIARAHWIAGLACAAVYIAHRLLGPRSRPPAG